MDLGAPNAGAGAVLTELPPRGTDPKLGAGAAATGAGGVTPPLLAPAIFSCVRPYAAIPSMAPMAMWNKPAPCNVIGDH